MKMNWTKIWKVIRVIFEATLVIWALLERSDKEVFYEMMDEQREIKQVYRRNLGSIYDWWIRNKRRLERTEIDTGSISQGFEDLEEDLKGTNEDEYIIWTGFHC